MKKSKLFLTGVILTMAMTTMVGCGNGTKEVGHEDILQQVADGNYDINATQTDANGNELLANTDGWVVESYNIDDAPGEIKNLTKKIDKKYDIKMYIAYKVENNTIKYAFTGFNENHNKELIYVIQNVDKSISVEVGDYNDISDIYLGAEQENPSPEYNHEPILDPNYFEEHNGNKTTEVNETTESEVEENSTETNSEENENETTSEDNDTEVDE